MAMSRKRKVQNKEAIAEDYCFACKDGGHLRVCDYKNCIKSYHPECVNKDPSLLVSNERWICDRHSCMSCTKTTMFHCILCTNSVCRSCIRSADFVLIKRKKTKGFCANCLEMTIMIEKNMDESPEGEKVNFYDKETVEYLFMDYWMKVVKDKEGLALVDLEAAQAMLKGDKMDESGSESEHPEDDVESESEEELEDEDDDEMAFINESKVKSYRTAAPSQKARTRRRYSGWASEELIEFLSSIGKDTAQKLEQNEVSEIIKQYIHSHNLLDADKKKKKVNSDQKLKSLFRRKSFRFNKIYALLEKHFAENADVYSSEESDGIFSSRRGRGLASAPKVIKLEVQNYKEKLVKPKSIYASFVYKNIQSVYLRRSLMVELLKNAEMFEYKVLGCFVRVKNDPNDFFYSPDKSHQICRVTGIRTASDAYMVGDTSTNIALKVSNIVMDVRISSLSDEDFDEHECEDLRQLVKKGVLKRITIAELEKKIRVVHEDIMNHWIGREIKRLDKMIERANEKGWRKELEDHYAQKVLLQKSEERIRLLKDIPPVIEDIEEVIGTDTASALSLDESEDRDSASPRPVKKANSANKTKGKAVGSGNGVLGIDVPFIPFDQPTQEEVISTVNPVEGGDQGESSMDVTEQVIHLTNDVDPVNKNKEITVIDLDDDEDIENTDPTKDNASDTCVEIPEIKVPESQAVWNYLDPQGNQQGPFPMKNLREWSRAGYFRSDFKVWRTGQPKEKAILLSHALHLTTP